MKFKSAYSKTSRHFSGSGTRFRNKYVRETSGELVKDGVEDVYDSIQKAAQGITVDDLIKRARTGDPTAIGQPIDSYADVSSSPRDLLEAHSMLNSAHDKYNSLPADLRKEFGNNFESFLKASVDGRASSYLQKASQKSNSPKPLSADELSKIRSVIGGKTDA